MITNKKFNVYKFFILLFLIMGFVLPANCIEFYGVEQVLEYRKQEVKEQNQENKSEESNITSNISEVGNLLPIGVQPKVSAIVPVYKVEPWIRECMDSLVNQTLKEIEIICVDDGSPDNCGKILDEYAAKDNRIVVIHQENKGVQEARNAGILRATGEYISFVDSDDYLQTNAYEVAYNAAHTPNTETGVDILQFRFRAFRDENDSRIIVDNNYSEGTINSISFYLGTDYHYTYGTGCCTKLFKSELIKNYSLKFIKGIRPADDTCFLYMALGRAKNVKTIPTTLYNYRIYNSSLSHSMSNDNNFLSSYKIIKYISDDWVEHNLSDGVEHLLLGKLCRWANNWCRKESLKYAKVMLSAFNSKIYNPETVKKCNITTQQLIRELEYAAAHPEKYQDNSSPLYKSSNYPKKQIKKSRGKKIETKKTNHSVHRKTSVIKHTTKGNKRQKTSV